MNIKLLSILLLPFLAIHVNAQSNPEVYLGDFELTENGFDIYNLENISNNPGYDNQPSFLIDGGAILYSSSRDYGETDIVLYDISNKKNNWLTNSQGVSEYSPVQTPEKISISTISLSTSGEQQFWKLVGGNPNPVVLEKDVIIGYYTWYDAENYFCFVLSDEENPATLQQHSLSDDSKSIIINNPGRSIHKIPGKEEISFVDKNDSTQWVVKTYDPESKQIQTITTTPEGSEDMFWVDSSSFLIGQENGLLMWKEGHGYTAKVPVFQSNGTISRISLNSDRTKIALVFTED
tara:strand:- start:2227 stop:3102 length:876 start_codon:yes stop_codon:yes gene_type:complete